MKLEGYKAFDDPYVYPGTSVLRNRLGTRDSAILESFEVEMSALRAEEPLPRGRFGPAHYRGEHRHLFQDVYVWAGRYRTVRIAKDEAVFCYPENIAAEMDRAFADLRRQRRQKGVAFDVFIRRAASFLSDLNAIHPFRDGNGRAQLAFLQLVSVDAGHPLDLTKVCRSTFLPAMENSFAGDLDPLKRELMALRG